MEAMLHGKETTSRVLCVHLSTLSHNTPVFRLSKLTSKRSNAYLQQPTTAVYSRHTASNKDCMERVQFYP